MRDTTLKHSRAYSDHTPDIAVPVVFTVEKQRYFYYISRHWETYCRMFWKMLSLLATGLLAAATAKAAEMEIPFHNTTREPLVINKDGHLTGIYPDLFREIMRRAEIPVKLIPTPKLRVRRYFETGKSVLSCCDNPAWRRRPMELTVQLFSDPFYRTNDIFVFPADIAKPIKNLRELSGLQVATVRGYGYQGEEWFGERIDFADEKNILRAVSAKRIDIGIVNEDVVRYWSKTNPDSISSGGIHDSASLHIRVHRSRNDLLERINTAIGEIIADGTRDRIIAGYLEGRK